VQVHCQFELYWERLRLLQMLLFAISAFQLVLPERRRQQQLQQDLPPVQALLQKNLCQLQSMSKLRNIWNT
jgi:hypothetical protein